MSARSWYAFTDTEEIVNLGDYESIEDAFAAADMLTRPSVWVFAEGGLQNLIASAQVALSGKVQA